MERYVRKSEESTYRMYNTWSKYIYEYYVGKRKVDVLKITVLWSAVGKMSYNYVQETLCASNYLWHLFRFEIPKWTTGDKPYIALLTSSTTRERRFQRTSNLNYCENDTSWSPRILERSGSTVLLEKRSPDQKHALHWAGEGLRSNTFLD